MSEGRPHLACHNLFISIDQCPGQQLFSIDIVNYNQLWLFKCLEPNVLFADSRSTEKYYSNVNYRQLHVISILIGPKLHMPFPVIFRTRSILHKMLK